MQEVEKDRQELSSTISHQQEALQVQLAKTASNLKRKINQSVKYFQNRIQFKTENQVIYEIQSDVTDFPVFSRPKSQVSLDLFYYDIKKNLIPTRAVTQEIIQSMATNT